MTHRNTRRGFTLIELLVVVLIIGVLAAAALPQYQKAVERSKATQGLTLLKTLAAAYQAAYLEKGSYPFTFTELDINFPFTGQERFMSHSFGDSKSNKDWILEIENHPTGYITLFAVQNSGKYKGAGFAVNIKIPDNTSTKQPMCFERKSHANFLFDTHLAPGAYCQQVIQGSYKRESEFARYYKLP